MIGLLLAAGTGSRLTTRTKECPKALIQVQGRPLVDYALDFLEASPFRPLVVVSGFLGAQLESHLSDRGRVTVVRNPDFEKGNLLSLLSARPHLQNGFAVVNVDHIYPRRLLPRLTPIDGQVTALCDFDRSLGPDDMKVQSEGRRHIKGIAKTFSTFDAGYIGCTLVPPTATRDYFEAVERVQTRIGIQAVVEQVLAELAASTRSPAISDTSGIQWLEVDDESDLQKAEHMLSENPDFLR